MKKIIFMSLVALIMFSGCNEDYQNTGTNKVHIDQGINIYCDIDTNVEYFIFKGYKSGGMTVRYNLDGSIKGCT